MIGPRPGATHKDASMPAAPTFRWNLFAAAPLRRMLKSPWLPVAFQAVALVAMTLLALNGWGIGPDIPGKDLMTLRKTNLTTLAVWGLWWPGMILMAVLAGRLWCTVCPMELVSRAGHALGRKTGLAKLPMGRFLRAGWLILAAYVVLQLLVAGLSMHRVPHPTSILLIVLGGTALLSGLLFREERAFCKALCPAAALLSVYGRSTRLQLDKADPTLCEACETKDCVAPANRDRLDARSCPSLLRPFDRASSDGCVLCFQCAKVCPQGNIGFGSTTGEASSRRHRLLKPFEAGFVMIATGFVTHELVGEVKWLDAHFHKVPTLLATPFPAVAFGWFEALWFLLLFPALFWGLVALVARLAGHRERLGTLLLAAATGAAPVVALAHVAKALAKLGSWGGFLPQALRDPQGLATLQSLGAKQIAAPTPLWGLGLVGWLILGGMALLGWRALRGLREHPEPQLRPALQIGMASAFAFFTAVLMIWARG